MSVNYGGFRPLLNETSDEPFLLNHKDWNAVSEFLRAYLGWIASGYKEGRLPHAWKTRVRWDFTIERWVIQVAPGFVRGHEVMASTTPYLVPEDVREKLGIKVDSETDLTKKIDVSILNRPEIFIPTKLWRPVATGAPTAEGDVAKEVPRSIQERYNIVVSSKVNASTDNIETGVTVDISEELEQDRENARVAYCVELVLRQPRASVQFAPPTEAVDKNYLELAVKMTNPKDDPPYLELTRESPLEIEASESVSVKVALEGVDPGYDTVPIATIWMLGPVGDLEASEVTEEWQPVVQYHTFYNLDHSVDIDIDKIPAYRQINPAAGLLSGVVVQAAVEIMNEVNRQAEEAYQRTAIRGKFWTV
jgi:hypothetical protein